ncbi:MAG: small multi-drug export protein [Clostridia bacterium]|nr:small multi-drug export protein [Clostridia bacterium]
MSSIELVFSSIKNLGDAWSLFIVSIIPFIELRGAIPFGILKLGMPWYEAFLISFISNCIPVPIVILLTRPLFNFLKKTKRLAPLVQKIEAKMMKKSEKVTKYKIIGLFLFVAIPLPGTGAYSGSVIAALLDMRLKKSIPSIVLGIFVAGLIISLVSAFGSAALSL